VEQFDCDFLNQLSGGNLRYFVGQLERAPSTGTVHFQCYVEWRKPQRGSVFSRWAAEEPSSLGREYFSAFEPFAWCSGIHVELRLASREAARQYCMVREFKGEDKGYLDGPWEWGEFEEGGRGRRSDLAVATAWISSGGDLFGVAQRWPDVFVKFERGLSSLEALVAPREFRDVEGWVLWGATGAGKSHFVYEAFGVDNVHVVASEAPFWLGPYRGQPVLLFEEFASVLDIKTLLRVVDGYPGDFSIKGGHTRGRWFRVILTGNDDFTRSWPPELKRRFGFSAANPGGNVRHCTGRGAGFPTIAEVGGGGPFPVVRRPFIAPRPVSSVAVPERISAGGHERGVGYSSLGSAVSVESSMISEVVADVGLFSCLGSGGGGLGEEDLPPQERDSFVAASSALLAPVERILPTFVRCLDGFVRESVCCGDYRCRACSLLP